MGGAGSVPSRAGEPSAVRLAGAERVPAAALAPTPDPGFRLLSIDGRRVKWGAAASGTPATLRYAFVARPVTRPGAVNCGSIRPFPAVLTGGIAFPEVMAEFRAAFASWEAAAGIRFSETDDAATADLLIGVQAAPRGIAFADLAPRSPAFSEGGTSPVAAICLNPSVTWETGFDGDPRTYDLRYVAAHEAGHILGLDHAGRGPGRIMGFRYREVVRRPQPGDIAGARLLYGPPVPAAEAALRSRVTEAAAFQP